MNSKTSLIEEYVNFVDMTKKQNKYFKINIILFMVILCLFSFFVFLNMIQSSIFTIITIIRLLFTFE